MARVNYVACPSCHREYYIDRILSDALETNPAQTLKCPFCKKVFNLGTKTGAEKPKAANIASPAR
jgi:transposase-like protein